MIRRSEIFLKQCVILLDAAALIAAFLGTYFLRRHIHHFYTLDLIPGKTVIKPLEPLDKYLWLLLIILPIWIAMLALAGEYRNLRMKAYSKTALALLEASAASLLLFGSVTFLLKIRYVSRVFMLLFFLLSFSLLSLERAFLVLCFRLMLRRGYFYRNMLVVGTGQRAHHLIRVVQAHQSWGLRIIGLLDEDHALVGKQISGIHVIGVLKDLPLLLQEQAIDEVVFVVPRNWMERIEPAILHCELVGVRATVSVDLFNMKFARIHPTDLDGIPLVSFETAPVVEWQLAIKRVSDLLASSVGLVVLSPLFLIAAILVKVTSPGPVFFRQERCGLNGRRFILYKFRSMGADAEFKKGEMEHLNELSGPVFKITNDPRLTPIGSWLRKASIDELPQLINVFKGEMSLVGPRPPLPSEVNRYEVWQRRRLSMRPGITGFWQVSGRNKIQDFEEWIKLDLEYIDRWSLKLDAKILLKTIPTVLFGVGAK